MSSDIWYFGHVSRSYTLLQSLKSRGEKRANRDHAYSMRTPMQVQISRIAFENRDPVDLFLFHLLGPDLVTRTTGLGDDTLELVDLLLGTAESTELWVVLAFAVARQIGMIGIEMQGHTLFLASLRARLSLLFRRSSITRRS